MLSLDKIIIKSKERLKNSFFRICKNDNNDSYKIIQYFGPIKTSTEMMRLGWNNHSYLADEITNEYPIFNISDFISDDRIHSTKKD